MNGFHQKNKLFFLLIACGLLILPGCGRKLFTNTKQKYQQPKKKKSQKKQYKKHKKEFKAIEATPLEKKVIDTDFDGSEGMLSETEDVNFDSQDLNELFDDIDQAVDSYGEEEAPKMDQDEKAKTARNEVKVDYDWAEDVDAEHSFKTIYFDHYDIRNDQREAVTYDAAQLKQFLSEARSGGQEPKIIVEGHACSSAGSKEYNFSISHNRAREVVKLLEKEGVLTKNIKIVGRGQEIPAIVDGKAISGTKTEQWPNRRVEVRILNS